MLLPGGQKFEVYRIGYNAVCCGNLPGGKAKNCPGKPSDTSAPEVWVDYRCHAPSRFVGTGLPPGVEPFLRRVAAMSDAERSEVEALRAAVGSQEEASAEDAEQGAAR